jgi:hypothetical protein
LSPRSLALSAVGRLARRITFASPSRERRKVSDEYFVVHHELKGEFISAIAIEAKTLRVPLPRHLLRLGEQTRYQLGGQFAVGPLRREQQAGARLDAEAMFVMLSINAVFTPAYGEYHMLVFAAIFGAAPG